MYLVSEITHTEHRMNTPLPKKSGQSQDQPSFAAENVANGDQYRSGKVVNLSKHSVDPAFASFIYQLNAVQCFLYRNPHALFNGKIRCDLGNKQGKHHLDDQYRWFEMGATVRGINRGG